MLTAEQREDLARKGRATRARTADQAARSAEFKAAIRKRIRTMRDEERMSWRAIARQLNEEQVPTLKGGAEWRQSSVQSVGGYVQSPWGASAANHRVSTEHVCESCGRTFLSWSNKTLCSRCYGLSRGFVCEGCGTPVLRAHVRRCRSCQNKDQTATGNGRWKGGRRIANGGYVYIYSPDHPHASKARVVPEHVLVVEQVIGRYLLPGENVHHKNGVRDDNRPENLELWVKSQPAGQRAVDLLAWAREIIERYEPVEGQLRLFG